MPFAAAATMVTLVAPTTLMGTMTANTMAMTHGKKVTNWWWNRLYRSRSLKFIFQDHDPDLYFLVLVTLAMIIEKKGYDTNTRKMTIPPNTLYLIADKRFRYHSTFFDANGRKIRDYVYFPIKDFLVDSVDVNKRRGRRGVTRLLICPITDGLNVYGFDAWTYQWFWGGVGSKSLTPAQASRALRETLRQYQTFTGIEERLRIVKMATGKVPAITEQDKKLIQDYILTYHQLMNPSYQPCRQASQPIPVPSSQSSGNRPRTCSTPAQFSMSEFPSVPQQTPKSKADEKITIPLAE